MREDVGTGSGRRIASAGTGDIVGGRGGEEIHGNEDTLQGRMATSAALHNDHSKGERSEMRTYFCVGRLGHRLQGFQLSSRAATSIHHTMGSAEKWETDRICIAAGDERMSAAFRINCAASTSARAEMTLASPIRFCCAPLERDC